MPASPLRKLNAGIDERLGSQHLLRTALDHIFPDNWSFMIGETALYCFVLLVISGVYLTFFFVPSDATVTYTGSYLPLHGLKMSEAYRSAVNLSLNVRAGLLFRQIHHWSADLFLAAIAIHVMRIFFTGAFRKPRDINWVVGVSMLALSMFNGFTGYSLPGDLLSGIGLRIAYSITLSVPVLGNWLAYLFWGGQYPSDQLTHRLYIAHVLIAPMLIAALLGVHLALIWHQKHTQFPGEGRSEKRLVGSQLWPTYAARSIGLFFFVAGAVVLLSGVAQINPIWLYGPYSPEAATNFAQPDWYVGWLEGSLRLFPPVRIHLFGYTVSEVFWPAVFLPLGTFAVMYIWPWLERWLTGDVLSHNLLNRPRDRPGRTGFGVGVVTFYILLTIAGAQDVVAHFVQTVQPSVTWALRCLTLGLPVVTGAVAWKVCRDLQHGKPPEVETPEGPAGSAIPPPSRYLPARARYEQQEPAAPRARVRRRLRALSASAAAVVSIAISVAARLRVRRRSGEERRTRRGASRVG